MTRNQFIAILILLALVFVFPNIFSGSYILTVAIFSGINAIVTMGLCILMGYAGQVSLGQAGFYGIGAYVSAIMSLKYGIPVLFSIIIASIIASIAALLLAIPALRLKGHYLAVATLGFGEIIYIILNEWGPGGPSGFGNIPHFNIFSIEIKTPYQYFYLVWLIVILLLGFSLNVINSRIGRALRAMHESETASASVGINIPELKIKVFILGAIFASIAGSLYAHFVTFLSPSGFSLFYSILVLIMAVVGGISNIWGAVVGAVIITVLPELLKNFREFDVLAYGFILTVSLMFMRKGIVGIITEKLGEKRCSR